MQVLKRNGEQQPFKKDKINKAVSSCLCEMHWPGAAALSLQITEDVTAECEKFNRQIGVEEIQDIVETALMKRQLYEPAKKYIRYRHIHEIKRNTTDERLMTILEGKNEEAIQENANKNPLLASTQRDYVAGEISRDLTERYLLPQDIIDAHKEGIIHFHDSDYYIQTIHNCCLVNLHDMLQNGTVISGTKIDKPHTFLTACTITSQIVAAIASNQYGGQTITLSHLSPFVEVTRQKYRDLGFNEELVNQLTAINIRDGVQTLNYQFLTLMTTNGQAPFITVNMDLGELPEGKEREDLALVIEEVLNQRIQGIKNEKGVWITPAFPKLIYFLDEMNIEPESKYYYLTELSARCTAKRMVPDYISAKKMIELKGGRWPCMGCRSFLTPDRFTDAGVGNIARALDYTPGQYKYYGRFNQGVVTINLPYVALLANGSEKRFWTIFDEYLELCHRALRCRHERLKGTLSDVSPIHWQHGALARLNKGEPIDELLYHGYSTISLGYAGLAEAVYCIKEESHTSERGKQFGLAIMQYMVDKCNAWKEAEDIDYSVYGTPIESTTYKFAKAIQSRFGIIPHVSDKSYITNSYHVHVTEEIDAFSKLSFESEFQALSPGGAISYVEVPDMTHNIPAVLSLIRHIYDNILYAELNTKSDYCQVCGYDGELSIIEKGGKLIWQCPNCQNEDRAKMNIARRVCGYIGTNDMNQGRTQEIKERVLHL